MVRVWLDDLRDPARHVGAGWTWVTTVDGAVQLLAAHDVDLLSLDYDLCAAAYGCPTCRAGAACDAHESGAAVVAWLARHPQHRPREVRIHSANAGGAARLRRELAALGIAALGIAALGIAALPREG